MAAVLLAPGCDGRPWNSPYPEGDADADIVYAAFSDRPKHLDPAQSYSANEIVFTAQIYEPPLQYHYLKRPYELVPLAATRVPTPYFLDADGKRLPDDAAVGDIAFSVYDIDIKQGVRFQPHPAFAVDDKGAPRYATLSEKALASVRTLDDFKYTGTRELTAADYVYEIKRLAHPGLHSPIFGIMAQYIVGLEEYAQTLSEARTTLEAEAGGPVFLDLNQYPLAGARVLDRSRYRITLRGKYPQFIYWLAMPFFAPVPQEVDRFYSQPGMAGTQPHAGLVSGRHRSLHAVGQRSEPADGAGGQSQFPWRGLSGRAASRRTPRRGCLRTPASRCRWSTRRCSAGRRKTSPPGTSFCRAITTIRASVRTASIRPSRSAAGGDIG